MSRPTTTPPPPTVSTKAEKNWKTWLRGPGVLIGVALIVAFILVAGVFWDEAPVDDTALRLTYQEIPKQENGYYHLMKAMKVTTLDKDQIHQIELWMIAHDNTWDRSLTQATIKPLLQKNQTALEAIHQFIQTPQNQLPKDYFPDKFVTDSPFKPQDVLGLLYLQFYQAIDLKQSGQDDAAFQALFNTLRYSQKAQQYDFELIPIAIAIVSQRNTLQEMNLMLDNSHVSASQLKHYSHLLESYPFDRNHIANAYRGMHMRNSLVYPKQFEVFPPKGSKDMSYMMLPYLYQPNHTQNLDTAFFKAYIDNLFVPKTQWKPIPVIDPPNKFPELLGPNLMGKRILQALIPRVSENVQTQPLIMDSQLRLLQTKMALMAYKQEHGTLPKTLNELVPGYLSQIPIDPFDGKPLRYLPAQKQIFSIGKDMLPPLGKSATPQTKETLLESLVFPLAF